MDISDQKQRILAATKLLTQETTSKEKFDAIHTLIKGINPTIDKTLGVCSTILNDIEKLQSGEVITLSAEAIPEKTEEDKKRKRLLLLFIRSFKQLRSEVDRVQKELTSANQDGTYTNQEKITSFGKIAAGAKGPFGIITIAAVLLVGTFFFINRKSDTKAVLGSQTEITTPASSAPTAKSGVQGIIFNNKKIPLSQVYVGTGSDCDSPHYHALDHTAARALDGTIVADPGGCGFGKVKDVKVVTLDQ